MTARQLVDFASGLVEFMIETQGEVSAMYHLIDAKGRHHIVTPLPLPKDIMVALMRQQMMKLDVVSYIFMDEAWVVDASPDEAEEALRIGATNHPKRREVVVLIAEDDKGEICGSRAILRDGRKPRLGPLVLNEYSQSSGRMVGLLPARGAIQ
jgi:hypothetical protein